MQHWRKKAAPASREGKRADSLPRAKIYIDMKYDATPRWGWNGGADRSARRVRLGSAALV